MNLMEKGYSEHPFNYFKGVVYHAFDLGRDQFEIEEAKEEWFKGEWISFEEVKRLLPEEFWAEPLLRDIAYDGAEEYFCKKYSLAPCAFNVLFHSVEKPRRIFKKRKPKEVVLG